MARTTQRSDLRGTIGSAADVLDAGLGEELRRLRAVIDTAKLGFWEWDLASGRVSYSEAWKRQLGCADSAITTDISEWTSRLHPEERERMIELVRAFTQRPWSNCRVDCRMRHQDGSWRDMHLQLAVLNDARTRGPWLIATQLDITDSKRLEQQREARLRSVMDAIPHIVVALEPDGRMSYANAAVRDYCGPDARLETSDDRLQLLHPEDRAIAAEFPRALQEALQRPLPAGQRAPLVSNLLRMRGADGQYRWFRTQTSLVQDAHGQRSLVIATATDVDAQKKSEDSLHEAQARLRAALRVGGIGLLEWDAEKGRVHWDESLLCVLGRTRDDLESRSLEDSLKLLHEDDREPVRAAVTEALHTGEPLELECRVQRPDGALAALAIRASVELRGPGSPSRIIAAVVDVTHRKELEAEVLQVQKMDAIGQLAGGIAHDFNNLLTVILGQISLLKGQSQLPVQVADSVQDIDDAAKRAAGLTRQLLAFARRQLMQVRVVDLNQAVGETASMLRRIVGDGIKLSFEPAPTAVGAQVDMTMLSQLLINLTVNARDAMPSGGRCTIHTRVLNLDATEVAHIPGAKAGRWSRITVCDTGSGIAPEVLPRLFEPFFTTKGFGQGAGLGLSTVYGILKQHGGFVHPESTLGVGSAFHAYFPWVAVAPLGDERRAAAGPRRSPRSAKILLVEDEPAVRSLTRTVLQQLGHQVSVAEHAHDAIRIWKEQAADFDLLLTDMTMPGGMSGLELIAALRREKPALKAILCSGYSLDISTARTAGVDDVILLQKPWTTELLRRQVEGMLELQPMAAGPR